MAASIIIKADEKILFTKIKKQPSWISPWGAGGAGLYLC